MIKTWEFIKEHAEYVYALVCFGLAAWSFTHDDAAGGWVCVGIGLLMIPILQWLRVGSTEIVSEPVVPLTFEQGEIDALRKAGMEPMPTPGDIHDPENCQFCVVIDSDFNKGGKW